MKNVKLLIILLLFLLLIGCVATGTRFNESIAINSENNNVATVILYRPTDWFGIGVSPTIYIDDIKKGTLSNGGFASIDLPLGTHTFSAKWNFLTRPFGTTDTEISLELKENRAYFLRFGIIDRDFMIIGSPTLPGIVTGKFVFFNMEKQYALKELGASNRVNWR